MCERPIVTALTSNTIPRARRAAGGRTRQQRVVAIGEEADAGEANHHRSVRSPWIERKVRRSRLSPADLGAGDSGGGVAGAPASWLSRVPVGVPFPRPSAAPRHPRCIQDRLRPRLPTQSVVDRSSSRPQLSRDSFATAPRSTRAAERWVQRRQAFASSLTNAGDRNTIPPAVTVSIGIVTGVDYPPTPAAPAGAIETKPRRLQIGLGE